MSLSQKRLKELFIYEPLTGLFTSRIGRSGVSIGAKMGCIHPTLGYVYIGVDGGRYLGHRLAWLYMTGKWPDNEIDHKDQCRSNNRWNNLREASSSQNKCNTGPRKNSKLGTKGIWQLPYGTFRVCIKLRGRKVHDKVYKNLSDAKKAHQTESIKYHGEFSKC